MTSAPARAEEPTSPLAAGLLDMPIPPPQARRFETPDGALRFVLDRRGHAAFVRFEGDEEVHALRAAPGPRGDELYKTDTGDVMIRVTVWGAVTVFRDPARMGAPAAATGLAAPVEPPAPPRDVRIQLRALERLTAQRLGRPVPFVAPRPAGPETGVVADAAARAAQGLLAEPGARVSRVVIEVGARPAAALAPDGALHVTVNPQQGYAGRPSAEAIRRVAAGKP